MKPTDLDFEEFSKRVDEIMKKPIPWYKKDLYFQIRNTSFLLSFNWQFGFELCETYPYAPDGEVPLLFLNCGFLQIIVESKRLYKFFYDRKYKCDLEM